MNLLEEDAREIEAIYNGLLEQLKDIAAKKDMTKIAPALYELVDSIIGILTSRGESLLLYTGKIFDKDYTYAHSLNTALISIKIGLRLEYDRNRLRNLGFLAISHPEEDMGLDKGLLEKPACDKEMEGIIGLADVYDSVTHPPPYRHATTPAETLTSIVQSNRFFEKKLIKILLEELSFYPKGSWVELCTGEIGRVVKVNRNLPLRPTVKIFFAGDGEQAETQGVSDLSQNNLIYILRPLTQEEMDKYEPRK